MNQSEQERIAKLLKESLLPLTDERAELAQDLWPAMLQRLQQHSPPVAWFNQVWFDCALVATAVAALAFVPSAIPVLLYHL